jgi:hypothetical protein
VFSHKAFTWVVARFVKSKAESESVEKLSAFCPQRLAPTRRGTIALASIVWTISPPWFVVTLRNRMMP